MKKIKLLAIISISLLMISIMSLFISILAYTNGSGEHRSYSVIDLVFSNDFEQFVTVEYMGVIYFEINGIVIDIFIIIGIAAILCALIGIFTLSKQKHNTWL